MSVQSGKEVSKRFEMQDTQTFKMKGGISVTFSAASQAGYYPSDRNKANQDAFIAGEIVQEAKPKSRSKSLVYNKERDSGILFAVFDGHGPNGRVCARSAAESVRAQFVGDMMNGTARSSLSSSDHALNDTTRSCLSDSDFIQSSLSSSYRRASSNLEKSDIIDASQSGTTATSPRTVFTLQTWATLVAFWLRRTRMARLLSQHLQ